jgi:hypothetical protein
MSHDDPSPRLNRAAASPRLNRAAPSPRMAEAAYPEHYREDRSTPPPATVRVIRLGPEPFPQDPASIARRHTDALARLGARARTARRGRGAGARRAAATAAWLERNPWARRSTIRTRGVARPARQTGTGTVIPPIVRVAAALGAELGVIDTSPTRRRFDLDGRACRVCQAPGDGTPPLCHDCAADADLFDPEPARTPGSRPGGIRR